MSLRVFAIAAPQFAVSRGESLALQSEDPASLFNACRLAASHAEQGIGAWGDSNWARSRHARRAAVMLMDSLAECESEFRLQLETLRPNLLLIGAMTICLPGAIACAKIAKEILGDEVCIVLGGRHPSESFYTLPKPGGVVATHHISSPLRLMEEGKIPPVFDVVVAGSGEYFIAGIGELVARTLEAGRPAAQAGRSISSLASAPGKWLAGVYRDGHISVTSGPGSVLGLGELPAPCAMFGVRSRFNVFNGRPTAHVFSDVGGGCVFDCTFCSERRSIMGVPEDLNNSAERLFRQISAAVRVIKEDYPGQGASAFVEDSTFLAFGQARIEQFVKKMMDSRLDVQLGGQATIDQILAHPNLLTLLNSIGVKYMFVGVETFSPKEIGGMHKDVGRRRGEWIERVETAFGLMSRAGIGAGVALLFGLGESHASRQALVEQLHRWRRTYGMPFPISMNWAVQHPLRGIKGGGDYSYTDWAIPEGEFIDAFRDFGEASVIYPIVGKPRPVLEEVREIRDGLADLLVT